MHKSTLSIGNTRWCTPVWENTRSEQINFFSKKIVGDHNANFSIMSSFPLRDKERDTVTSTEEGMIID